MHFSGTGSQGLPLARILHEEYYTCPSCTPCVRIYSGTMDLVCSWFQQEVNGVLHLFDSVDDPIMHGHRHDDESMHHRLVALKFEKLNELESARNSYFNLINSVIYANGCSLA